MSSADNIATVESIYDAFSRGDAEAILAVCADDVDWAAEAADVDKAPWYGQRTDKNAVMGFFGAIAGAIDVDEVTQLAIAANDEDEVFALLHFRAHAKATGRSVDMNLHHYWHLTNGKVDKYRGSEDSAQMQAMLQPEHAHST